MSEKRSGPPTRSDFRHWVTVLVHWGDMDAFGHVNNAKYFTYCESARISYFEAIGLGANTTTPVTTRSPAARTVRTVVLIRGGSGGGSGGDPPDAGVGENGLTRVRKFHGRAPQR